MKRSLIQIENQPAKHSRQTSAAVPSTSKTSEQQQQQQKEHQCASCPRRFTSKQALARIQNLCDKDSGDVSYMTTNPVELSPAAALKSMMHHLPTLMKIE